MDHETYESLARESTAMLLVLLQVHAEAKAHPESDTYVLPKEIYDRVDALITSIEEADQDVICTLPEGDRQAAMEFIDTMVDVFKRKAS